MTRDPVDEVIHAYLDHLEKGAPEPSLDHLTPEQRQLAKDLINSLHAGRGINPYQSRPSVRSLLADSEFASAAAPRVNVGLTVDAIRPDVVSSLGSASEPIADGAAQNEGIRSDAVIRYATLRIRVQFRDDVATVADLARVDPRAAAAPVFGRFAETPAIVLVIGDEELSSVAIDPFDTEEFIGTPDGQTYPPRITRPILPLFDTLRRLVDELAPDISVDDVTIDREVTELTDIIDAECAAACGAVVEEGKKARIDAKKETWPVFEEHALLVALNEAAAAGDLTEAVLDERITSAAAA
ncbi:MAG: hypothetical protein M3277_12470 [Actinomycetota bacterium]|nr:hypothetical protein [Actinomycetota bacterium]